jgi:hypothetical protein
MLVQKNQQLMEELEEASIWRDQVLSSFCPLSASQAP